MTRAKKEPAIMTPADMKGCVVLFRDVGGNEKFRALQDCVLLISDVEESTDFVFGVIVNRSWKESFYKFMRAQHKTLTDAFRFVQMFDAAQDGFEPQESNHASFLVRAQDAHHLPAPEIFGAYALHVADNGEEAKLLAEKLTVQKDVLILYSQFMLPLEELVALRQAGKIEIARSNPDHIFNSSAFMRGVLSFPGYFLAQKKNPEPKI